MAGLVVRPLDPTTWPGFASLVERHNGVWGGCWCMSFHAEGFTRATTAEQNRAAKERLVREGRAHAALVYDGMTCVGWCQFGPTAELPRIKSRRAYEAGLTALPDWRITCFFVDRARRGRGIAAAALDGALDAIAHAGGGTVEGYPEDVAGRSAAASFLWSGTLALFEQRGFARTRQIGKSRWVVIKKVARERLKLGS
jgi:GNAT superfamily N-acetyltransferase